jgi:hypothetical protein
LNKTLNKAQPKTMKNEDFQKKDAKSEPFF